MDDENLSTLSNKKVSFTFTAIVANPLLPLFALPNFKNSEELDLYETPWGKIKRDEE